MARIHLLIVALLLASCSAAPAPAQTPVIPTGQPAVATKTPTPSPSPAVPTNTPTASAAPTDTPALEVCSPLADVALGELPEIVSNPYEAPRTGLDDGHHGVDFSYYHRGSHDGMQGLPVYAALGGRVAGVTDDRPPYGNMLIIETPLDALPPAFLEALGLPGRLTLVTPDARLSCPVPEVQPDVASPQRSLYLLYAHFDAAPLVGLGDAVTCGQPIGAVGNSGFSGNPHLHFEARLGPSGAAFGPMSHYNNRSTQDEMANYCLWRVSGAFALLDPLNLLEAGVPFSR